MASVVLFLFSFLVFTLSTVTSTNKWDCADYYWRDYFGTIPHDAVPAGKDKSGDKQYIGLVYIRNYEYLPATILPKQGIAKTTAYAHVLTTTQNVKILCSPFKEAFDWIQVESKDLKDYLSRRVIPGGSEVGENLFIGRVFRNGDVIIGKVFQHYRNNRGIWFPLGNGPANSLTYELLVYDCDKIDLPTFDVRLGVTAKDKNDVKIINTY